MSTPIQTVTLPSEFDAPRARPACVVEDLGRMEYAAARELQEGLAGQRKTGEIADRLLFVEHPHVITLGRNARKDNVLLNTAALAAAEITIHETNRGGDVTYHGPGQVVGYPILDLREWKRDVVAYVRAIEEVLIGAVGEFGIEARREPGCTGVWTGAGKLAAIGVHISRWVTSHGFALNVSTDSRYFGYIVPCGLARPVTSMEAILETAPLRDAVIEVIVQHFGRVFGRSMIVGRSSA